MKLTRRTFGMGIAVAALAGAGYYGWILATQVAPTYANLAYGTDERNVLDIYLPEGTGPFPYVMEFHGGGFVVGDKAGNPVQAEILDAGIAVVRINYRFSSTAIWPAQADDSLAAVAFISEKGAEYGIDPTRAALWGKSAGGFLAASAALSLTEMGKPVQGVANFFGPMDFSVMDQDMADLGLTPAMGLTNDIASAESALIGFAVGDDPAKARAIGPIGRLDGKSLKLPPLMVRHGDADTFIAYTQGKRLADAWAASDPTAIVDFAVVAGASHGSSEFGQSGVVTPLVAFLTDVLKP
jgi:acetyl esterase/lipase